MSTFRFMLSSVICLSLPIIGLGVANAGGDTAKPFKDSTNNSAAKRGVMTIERGSGRTEKNLTESFSLSSRLPSPGANCNLSTQQTIDLNPQNYRWHNEDVNEEFSVLNIPGFILQSARLCIKYHDVDFTSHPAYTPELNVVQFGATTIGILPGENGQTLTKCWDVKSRLQQNTNPSIPFIINIDAAHSRPAWAVYLHKAVLSACYTNVTLPWLPLPYIRY